MQTPLQQRIPPDYEHAYAQMWAAYEGEGEAWREVTRGLRDALVGYAVRRCAFYARTIAAGVPFEDIPLLTKAALRDHFDELLARGVPAWRRYEVKTSGSTGEPVTLLRDIRQILVESAASDRFFRSLHGVPFDATMVAVTSTARSVERVSRWERLRAALVSKLGGPPARDPWLLTAPTLDIRLRGTLQEHLDLWGRLRSYFLLGQPSALDWMAQEIEAGHVRLRRPPVAIAATGDMLTSGAKERMERVFGAWVHTRYGSIEVPYLAVSLPNTTEPYACNPLLGYVEVVDEDGRPVRPGRTGRVVVTDLNNRVMPLIRYVLGDLAVASERGYVGGFRLLEGLVGRESEVLRFPSGRILTAPNLDKVVSHGEQGFAEWVRAFQVAQTGPNALELRIVWARSPGDIRGRIEGVLRSVADPDTEIRIRDVDELERHPSGKVWMVRGLGASGPRLVH